MPQKLTNAELTELRSFFSDSLNYDSSNPSDPIDPLTYKEPAGDACLHIAAHRGNYRATELLIKAGVDVNQVGEMGSTPLHYANAKGHREVAKLLLSHGARADIKDAFGRTAAGVVKPG
jgi:ankyrin repeat protein